MFELKSDYFLYTNGKEKLTFKVKELQSISISKDSIYLQYLSSKRLISFLEITEEDYKEIKSWFQKRLPNITTSKGN